MAENSSCSNPIDICSSRSIGHISHALDVDLLDTDALSLLASTSNLGVLPDASHRTKDEVVLKLNLNTEWQLRRLILSKDKLMIANPGQSTVTDQIPLVSCLGEAFFRIFLSTS